jgi:hypothetical protein
VSDNEGCFELLAPADDPFIYVSHMSSLCTKIVKSRCGSFTRCSLLFEKKESNDRISTRLSRAYWPFLPLLHPGLECPAHGEKISYLYIL